jgi:serine/threonine protein kinase
MESEQAATIGDGRYAIDRRIGVGGCGAVYLAYDTVLNRWVAIKRVETEGGISDPFREARQLASLHHQNIVMVYDFFRSEGQDFVVMEYINGQSLNELTEPMELEFFTTFAKQCLEGLAAAHAIGMVHRDIKPANIMLTGTPSGGFQTKLLDFGLAKVMSEPSQQTMDHLGSITGSIHTISPEQLSRQPMDHRADLYSLGCVFYKALTMRFPFLGDDVPSLIAAHLQHDFTPLSELRPDLPRGLVIWVEKLFAYNKDDRHPSASEALQKLEVVTKPPSAPRPKTTTNPILSKPAAPQTPPSPQQPSRKEKNEPSDSVPFHRTQNFTIAMVAAIAVCLTIAILALTGNMGHGESAEKTTSSNLFGKKKKTTPTPAERKIFKSTERGEIRDMVGKEITIIGDIDRLEKDKDDKGKYLIFQGSDPSRDVMIFFDTKTEAGDFELKRKYAGHKVQATGVVKVDGSKLLLELASKNDLKLHTEVPTATPSPVAK